MDIRTTAIVAGSAGVVVGAAAGYLIANKRAELKWKAIADEEILSVKKNYGGIDEYVEDPGPDEADQEGWGISDQYGQRVVELGYREDVEHRERPEAPAQAVLPEPDASFEPTPVIDKGYPYPVNSDEFFMDHKDYPKITIHYYVKDDILCDDREEIIMNRQELIGNSLKHFGFDKTEPDTVFVINHQIGAAYEVCRDPDAYQTVVQGIPFD